MKIAINDTNILIDFYDINLLEELMSLDLEMHTTDFVINEIEIEEQLSSIETLVANGNLKVNQFSVQELVDIADRKNNNNRLSLTDCSVWFWAENNNATLLTGDGLLRKTTSNSGVEVHGSLWLLDQLYSENIIDKNRACLALTTLMSMNNRLPQNECEKRRQIWCS